MYVEGKVSECDFTERTYDSKVNGAHVIAQGGSGRWCAVMHAGPEYLKENNIIPTPRHEAIEKVLEILQEQAAENGKSYTRMELDVMYIDF